jgi:hypothetical protein
MMYYNVRFFMKVATFAQVIDLNLYIDKIHPVPKLLNSFNKFIIFIAISAKYFTSD